MIPWVATGLAAAGAWAWKYRTRLAAWGSALLIAWRMRSLRRRGQKLAARVAREQAVVKVHEAHRTIEEAHDEIDRQILQARDPDALTRIVDRLRQAP